jgi:hypothetical protein
VVASTASSVATAGARTRRRAPPSPEPALTSTLPPEQQAALHAAKLRALVTDHEGPLDLEPSLFPGGAAARAGDRGWFLAGDEPARALGAALAWASRHDIGDLRVLAESATEVLARRAVLFAPAPSVWRIDGRTLTEVVADPAVEPQAAPAPLSEEFALLLADAGADVVCEHGVVAGEVLGLEIARVVVAEDGTAALEVGVGRHDREAFAMVHGDLPTRDALATVIATVRENRRAGAESHPLSRLAQERWVRAVLVSRPDLVGCARLEPVVPLLPRDSVKDVVPACLVGEDRDGRSVVVACSVGIDLDLVPTAAEVRAHHAPGARLLLALPERDDSPVTRRLAARLRAPAEIVVLPDDWRSAAVA